MKERMESVLTRIHNAAKGCGRDPDSVRLVAVGKTVPANRVREAVEAGVTILGENYVQEAREKAKALSTAPVSWHFIGHLQSNKAKYAVKLFDLIHTVDDVKLAMELDRQAGKINKIQEVLIQVNIARESTKSGALPEDVPGLVDSISRFKQIRLRGLMTIPPFFDTPEKARPFFAALRNLRDRLQEEAPPDVVLDELSMGMTGDFEAAISEGATLVRIGTAIYGVRQ